MPDQTPDKPRGGKKTPKKKIAKKKPRTYSTDPGQGPKEPRK
jgi:hypothetical protein